MKKFTPEKRLEIVNEVVIKQRSFSSVVATFNVAYSTLKMWIRNYESMGLDAFYKKGWANRTPAQNEAAVLDYLNGQGSLDDICKKHKISDTKPLRQWIMKYNGHEVLKSSRA